MPSFEKIGVTLSNSSSSYLRLFLKDSASSSLEKKSGPRGQNSTETISAGRDGNGLSVSSALRQVVNFIL
jgi:hypothetical protein